MDELSGVPSKQNQQEDSEDQFFDCSVPAEGTTAKSNDEHEEQCENFLDASDLFDDECFPIVLSSDAQAAKTTAASVPCYAVSTVSGGRIFLQKSEALVFLKRNAGSRFRACQSFEEAEYFLRRADVLFSQVAYQQADDPECKSQTDVLSETDQKASPVKSNSRKAVADTKIRINVKVNRDSENARRRLAAAENCAYRSVTVQQLNAFRRCIEQRNLAECTRLVDANPRYLVAQGDTPAILQESFRYNALHVAARVDAADIAVLILSRLRNHAFWTALYPSLSTSELTNVQARADFAVDMYINMPEKGAFETPLHFAAKFGSVNMCRFLLAQPSCDRLRANKFGESAEALAGSRLPQNQDREQRVAQLRALFVSRFYVALYRAPLDDTQGTLIAAPSDQFVQLAVDPAPRRDAAGSPSCCLLLNASASASLNESLNESQSDSFCNSLDDSNASSSASSLRLNAVAGPMDTQTADRFYRTWNSPRSASRALAVQRSRLDSPLLRSVQQRRRSLRFDSHGEADVNANPTSSTCDKPTLDAQVLHALRSDARRGVECVGRAIASEMKVGWCEFWPFLGRFVDLRSDEGLLCLEQFLRSLCHNVTPDHEQTRDQSVSLANDSLQCHPLSPLSELADSMSKLSLLASPSASCTSFSNQNDSPLLCTPQKCDDSAQCNRLVETVHANAQPVFLSGLAEPDRTDTDVWNALTLYGTAKVLVSHAEPVATGNQSDAHLALDNCKYPLLANWCSLMEKRRCA